MVNNIDPTQVASILGKTPLQSPNSVKSRPADNLDATLQIRFADLIEKAKQSPAGDAQAVQQAKELLLSGDLTSLQNIRSAAQNILDSGI